MRLVLCHHTVDLDVEHRLVTTTFSDGTSAPATPHETPEYHRHAEEKSTGDVMMYCWQHDLVHCLLAEIEGRPSPTLWAIAHGESDQAPEIEDEERRVAAFQRLFFMRE